MSGMDLKEQKYVCTLAECGTLVQAAEKLFITQPALSLYITNLEKTLGLPLFERRGKKFNRLQIEIAAEMADQLDAVLPEAEHIRPFSKPN